MDASRGRVAPQGSASCGRIAAREPNRTRFKENNKSGTQRWGCPASGSHPDVMCALKSGSEEQKFIGEQPPEWVGAETGGCCGSRPHCPARRVNREKLPALAMSGRPLTGLCT